MYTLARRSLIATRDLPAGTVLEADMITVKRPGFGIAPKHLELVVGRRAEGRRRGGRDPALGDGLSTVVADGGATAGLGHLGALLGGRGRAARARRRGRVPRATGRTRPAASTGSTWTPGARAAPALLLDTYTMPGRRARRRRRLPRRGRAAAGHAAGARDRGRARRRDARRPAPRAAAAAVLGAAPARRSARPCDRILVTTGGGALQAAGVATAAALRDAYPDATVAPRARALRDVRAAGRRGAGRRPAVPAGRAAAPPTSWSRRRGRARWRRPRPARRRSRSPLAPNQRPNAAALERAGAAVVAEPGEVVAAVGGLDRAALAVAGQRAVDGYGALRIAWRLAQLITSRTPAVRG